MSNHEYKKEELDQLYESTVQVTNWRNVTNRFYYSVVVAALIALGFIFFFGFEQSSQTSTKTLSIVAMLLLSVFGLAVCHTWIGMLNYYYGLNTAKFKALEKANPQNIFSFEYQILDELKKNNEVKVIRARKAEKTVPYFGLFVFTASVFASGVLATTWLTN